jgi:hypothetical protein
VLFNLSVSPSLRRSLLCCDASCSLYKYIYLYVWYHSCLMDWYTMTSSNLMQRLTSCSFIHVFDVHTMLCNCSLLERMKREQTSHRHPANPQEKQGTHPTNDLAPLDSLNSGRAQYHASRISTSTTATKKNYSQPKLSKPTKPTI